MPLLSGEAILISALINNQDVLAGRQYGLAPTHFIGYNAEYNWLLNYVETYNTEPSKDAFKEAFPHFYFSEHEDVRSACDMVFKAAGKRQITEAMTKAVELMGFGELDQAYTTLVKAEPLKTAPKPRRVLTDMDFLDNWDDEYMTLDTPYRTLTRATGGMKPGQIWYLAARPKNGKSAHLVSFVKKAVLDGARVKFFSLEMSEAEVRARFHAALATHFGYEGITLTGIRDRSIDKHVYKTFVGELDDRLGSQGGFLDIHTPREGMVTPGLIAASAEEYHLNVVDYIGLMRQDGGGRAVDDWRNLASISNDLKMTSTACNTTLLVASQINREGEAGTEPPRLSNLAGSDALGQDGDVIITMRRKGRVATAFSIEGNRHGPDARFWTTFDPDKGVYEEITQEQADNLVMDSEDL